MNNLYFVFYKAAILSPNLIFILATSLFNKYEVMKALPYHHIVLIKIKVVYLNNEVQDLTK